MHSAHWDRELSVTSHAIWPVLITSNEATANCTNKTVAVLGTGSSAIQIVPHVQKGKLLRWVVVASPKLMTAFSCVKGHVLYAKLNLDCASSTSHTGQA